MLNLELMSDRIARVKLEQRRNNEAQRKKIIFNDKKGVGADKEALDMQIKEKRRLEEEAKKEESAYDADMVHHSKLACILHARQVKEKHAAEKALVTYRKLHQQPQNHSEFDLDGQDHCRKTNQGDGQMTLPGLLGEDVESKSRLQRQSEQLREWLFQQQADQEAGRHQQKLEDQHYDQSREEMDKRAVELQRLEMDWRKAATIATKDYNLAMTEEKRRQEGKRGDKYSHLKGQLMSEDTQCSPDMMGAPGLCPSGVRPPQENIQQVIHFWKSQIKEKEKVEMLEKQEDKCYDRIRLQSDRTALLIERQQAKLKKQLRQNLDNTNVQLAQIQKQQKPDIEKGHIDESFFSQFNTSSR